MADIDLRDRWARARAAYARQCGALALPEIKKWADELWTAAQNGQTVEIVDGPAKGLVIARQCDVTEYIRRHLDSIDRQAALRANGGGYATP